ncbi:hypothetical protein OIU77_009254 [Salix suchowensis]|uniref:Uncharacterized protein n=1 Tax=Salix suchowensis TaxID=1278906 RepID=A0ABQ9AEZ5_9ROSI|nr:hypothetical protein OIU77_009254 [Salix suchowensis]
MHASTVPMDSSKLVLLLSLFYILLLQPSLTAAQPDFTYYDCNWNNFSNSNYTTDSNFHRNLNSVLSSIASDTQIDYGFYNLSAGEVPERVNAYALCRGDVAVDVCRSCVNNSARKILEVCPNTMDVFGVYELCMIRYSNSSMFGDVDGDYYFSEGQGLNVVDVTRFKQAVQTLFARLRARAASGNSFKKFASGNQSAGVQTVYATSQCTPDLSEEQCSRCLLDLFGHISDCCDGSIGATLTTPSCNLRWDIVNFFSGTLEILSPTTLPAPSQGKKSNTAVRIIVITVVTVVGVMILVIYICLFIRTRKQREKERVEIANKIESAESLQFAFSSIQDATEDFSEKNRLGQGGFGAVYKGVLPNGQEIAVKRLSKDSGQGDLEFKNEVLLLAKLQHRNLVKLLGFCLEGIERLLIYEFVPNLSLDHFIFGKARNHLIYSCITCNCVSFKIGSTNEYFLAWRNWREGTAQDIIDPVLSSGSATEMKRCIHIGLLCGQENAADRPTMASVVLMLTSSSLTLQIPSQPAFLMSNQLDMSFLLGQNSRVTD